MGILTLDQKESEGQHSAQTTKLLLLQFAKSANSFIFPDYDHPDQWHIRLSGRSTAAICWELSLGLEPSRSPTAAAHFLK